MSYYKVTAHPKDGEVLFYEQLLSASDVADARERLRELLCRQGLCAEDCRLQVEPMSLQACIEQRQQELLHHVYALYLKSFGYMDRPLREVRRAERELQARGELYYTALDFAARVVRLYELVGREVDLSRIDVRTYHAYIEQLALAPDEQSFSSISEQLHACCDRGIHDTVKN